MRKRYYALAGAAVLFGIYVFINAESSQEHYADKGSIEDVIGYVTLSVDCETFLNTDKAQSYIDGGVIPPDGIIIEPTQCELHEGDSAFSVLKTALDENKILIDYDNISDKSVYVKGISNVYEYDGGDLSGWMYSVNGEFPTLASSEYILSDGDTVKWTYTCNLGRDVGDSFEKTVYFR